MGEGRNLSSDATIVPPEERLPDEELSTWRGRLRFAENLLVVIPLAVLVILPLIEIILRKAKMGVSGSAAFVEHFTLIVGMLGGALAAREKRLLSLSHAETFLRGRAKTSAALLSGSFAAAITIFLGVASVMFLRSGGGKIPLAYGIRQEHFQWVLPLGFGLIALRLLWNSAKDWKGRLMGCGLTAFLVAVGVLTPISSEHLMYPALILLLVATLLGAPLFTTLGGLALILLWGHEETIASVSIEHYSLVTNPSLPTIPLFTVASYFLAEGGASRRLVRVFQALVGHIRGGPAIMTALVCAFFTSFTGASGVTILALGGLLMPVLLAAKYSERNALGLLTGAGSLGMLFPPCLPVILYSIVASITLTHLGSAAMHAGSVTMQKMFLGGIGPGILLMALTAWWGVRQAPKESHATNRFNGREAGAAMWEAKWELLLPVVAMVSLFGGFATPVEAAAVTAIYAFIIETFVYRDLKLGKDIVRVMTECGLLVGGVLLILGIAKGLAEFIVTAQVPDLMVNWVSAHVHSQWVFLLALNIFLLLVGCLMDIFSAIVVVVPLLVPLGITFGIDPIHLGIIFLANMELGYLHPPVGMNLFLSSYRFRKTVWEVTIATIPMMIVLWIGVLLITYLPFLTTALPHWLSR